jgi:hypothetical protein
MQRRWGERHGLEPLTDSIGETNRIGIEIRVISYIQSFSGSVSSLQHPFPSLSLLV